MTNNAVALAGVFTAISVAAGIGAWRLVDPGRRWGAILPAAAAFGVLYFVGHRLDWTIGPRVSVFGFDVALPWEILLAVISAVATALFQRVVADRLRA